MKTRDGAQWLTSGEAAILLGVTTQSCRNYARRGWVKFRRERNVLRWNYELQSVLALAAHRKQYPETRGIRIPLRDLINHVRASSAREGASSPVAGTIGSTVVGHTTSAPARSI